MNGESKNRHHEDDAEVRSELLAKSTDLRKRAAELQSKMEATAKVFNELLEKINKDRSQNL